MCHDRGRFFLRFDAPSHVGAVVENWEAIEGGLQKAAAWLTELPDKLAGLFSDAGQFITDGIKSFGAGLKDFFLSGGLIREH